MSDLLKDLKDIESNIASSPWSEHALYSAIRHVERNTDIMSDAIEAQEEGLPCGTPNKYDGTHLAKLRNLLPAVIAKLEGITEREAQVRAEEREKAKVLVEALSEEYREKLYCLYNTGTYKKENETWSHNFMSDGEELAYFLGLNPKDSWYDALEIQKRIANAVHPTITDYSDKIKGE